MDTQRCICAQAHVQIHSHTVCTDPVMHAHKLLRDGHAKLAHIHMRAGTHTHTVSRDWADNSYKLRFQAIQYEN